VYGYFIHVSEKESLILTSKSEVSAAALKYVENSEIIELEYLGIDKSLRMFLNALATALLYVDTTQLFLFFLLYVLTPIFI